MRIPKYTIEDLKKLPLRAIAAFAARCARRVEHLAVLPEDHPESKRLRSAVKDAIQMAEDFARGVPCTACECIVRQIEASRVASEGEFVREQAIGSALRAAHAAATALHALELQAEPPEKHLLGPPPEHDPLSHLADITADMAALDAFTAAVDASDALGYADNFIGGASGDYEALLALDLGSYPHAGKPIEPSPRGPLGPLWPEWRL
jgi:hypothetical protein